MSDYILLWFYLLRLCREKDFVFIYCESDAENETVY